MRYHYTATRMAKIKMVTISNTGEGVEKLDQQYTAGGNSQWLSHSGRLLGSAPQTKHALTT